MTERGKRVHGNGADFVFGGCWTLEGDLVHCYAIFAFPCLRNLRDWLGRGSGWGNKKELGMKVELMPLACCFVFSLLSSPFPWVAPGCEISLFHLYSNVKMQVICDEKGFYPISYQPVEVLPSGCTGQG